MDKWYWCDTCQETKQVEDTFSEYSSPEGWSTRCFKDGSKVELCDVYDCQIHGKIGEIEHCPKC
jgi:hypothetical protein